LLDRVDITGAIITADALHTQDAHAHYLHRRGAHYVFVVKGNRPRLRQQLAGLAWADIPAVDLTQNAGHDPERRAWSAGVPHPQARRGPQRRDQRDLVPTRPAGGPDPAPPPPGDQPPLAQ